MGIIHHYIGHDEFIVCKRVCDCCIQFMLNNSSSIVDKSEHVQKFRATTKKEKKTLNQKASHIKNTPYENRPKIFRTIVWWQQQMKKKKIFSCHYVLNEMWWTMICILYARNALNNNNKRELPRRHTKKEKKMQLKYRHRLSENRLNPKKPSHITHYSPFASEFKVNYTPNIYITTESENEIDKESDWLNARERTFVTCFRIFTHLLAWIFVLAKTRRTKIIRAINKQNKWSFAGNLFKLQTKCTSNICIYPKKDTQKTTVVTESRMTMDITSSQTNAYEINFGTTVHIWFGLNCKRNSVRTNIVFQRKISTCDEPTEGSIRCHFSKKKLCFLLQHKLTDGNCVCAHAFCAAFVIKPAYWSHWFRPMIEFMWVAASFCLNWYSDCLIRFWSSVGAFRYHVSISSIFPLFINNVRFDHGPMFGAAI